MKKAQIIIPIVLMVAAVLLNFYAPRIAVGAYKGTVGGVPLYGWLGLSGLLAFWGLVFVVGNGLRVRRLLLKPEEKDQVVPQRKLTDAELGIIIANDDRLEDEAKKAKAAPYKRFTTPDGQYLGPDYPHPIIFKDRCIGCHACVEACPHDVLAIVNGVSHPIAPDQCMEDTGCEVACPVNPKACIVLNTTKKVRPLPAPKRDGKSYETDAKGCYIIGDVSGVPLIKNAAKEGQEVIENIIASLSGTAPEPNAQYDVAIVGAGPGGASAAIVAHDKGLRYVCFEQNRVLETIAAYPQGKYVFLKPDNDWRGGIEVFGMGMQPKKPDEAAQDAETQLTRVLGAELDALVSQQRDILTAEMMPHIPRIMQEKIKDVYPKKLAEELREKIRIALVGSTTGEVPDGKLREAFNQKINGAERETLLAGVREKVLDILTRKIPGDQRENLLDTWNGTIIDKGVVINTEESCKEIKRAADGDYFNISTTRGTESRSYTARRVVIAIGLRGTPMKLRVKGEKEPRVKYGLANPDEFKDKYMIVVGGGNSAIEAAVDLVATRNGNDITFRPPGERNHVTLLVRSDFKGDLKFGNKMQIYQCMDAGVLDVKFGVAIKEITEKEVLIESTRTKQVVATLPNDYIFALIGGDKPDKFLEGIGIQIQGKKK